MWIIVMLHINNMRIRYILLQNKVTCRQIKTITYYLKFQGEKDDLTFSYMYLLLHKGKCENVESCPCNSTLKKQLFRFNENPNTYYDIIANLIAGEY